VTFLKDLRLFKYMFKEVEAFIKITRLFEDIPREIEPSV
jgi:hypothetical protein